jgi:RimJ/RimL family protein N-acetyltransferase
VLGELHGALTADAQVHTLIAKVHRENEPSVRLFLAAGYVETDRDGDWVSLSRPVPT